MSDNPWGRGNFPNNNNKNKRPSDDELEKLIKNSKKKVQKLFNNNGGDKKVFFLAFLIAIALWLASGIFTVNTKEEAVVLRFGKYVRTESAGLKYHLPYPIEKIIKMRVTDRYQEEIGSGFSSRYGSNSSGILMLTGDENIVQVNFEVQWKIANLRKFLFNTQNPKKTLRDSAESAMREVVATSPINDVLSDGRTAIQLESKRLLQEILDSYDAGILIEVVNMRGVPPSVVDAAFKDVQAAKINKEETINRSIAYSNEIIPRARGESQKIIEEAEGFKQEAISLAQGEADRFIKVYNEYKLAKQITKERLYLDTMEEVLTGMDKIIMENNSAVPYLPLTELKKREKND